MTPPTPTPLVKAVILSLIWEVPQLNTFFIWNDSSGLWWKYVDLLFMEICSFQYVTTHYSWMKTPAVDKNGAFKWA